MPPQPPTMTSATSARPTSRTSGKRVRHYPAPLDEPFDSEASIGYERVPAPQVIARMALQLSSSPPVSQATQNLEPTDSRDGKIVVVDDETGRSLGFLGKPSGWSYWSHPTVADVERRASSAMIVRIPAQPKDPFSLYITSPESSAEMSSSKYIGIRYDQQPSKAPKTGCTPAKYNVEGCDEPKKKQKTTEEKCPTLETWRLAECWESKPKVLFKYRAEAIHSPDAVASSRIWTLHERDTDVEELCMTWLENNGTTCELGAYVSSTDSQTASVSLYRCADFELFGEGLEMKRVRLVFAPEKSTPDKTVQ